MTPESSRSLADLARSEAPLRPRRAAAIVLAAADELLDRGFGAPPPDATDTGTAVSTTAVVAAPATGEVMLHGDGSVSFASSADTLSPAVSGDPLAAGAALGRWYHLLLVGREPTCAADAYEPHLRAELGDEQCALIARCASAAPGQWPTVQEWIGVLGAFSGGQRAEEPPARRVSRQRARLIGIVLLCVLVAATAVVLALAPRWWDGVTAEPRGAPAEERDAAEQGAAADQPSMPDTPWASS